ncbi:hypothetical protein FDG2_4537 [Candidatus Protofrankia californiensis]|uniref:Uncharacterized protein n=1 Tax=Candidatus Protofrankia californiensis TaxID=1839754 RepID=A0A1C3P6H4_9ACTN|nr:hypothetical protein FDG2_4537 [Candidatus Protofrankia californiensis]
MWGWITWGRCGTGRDPEPPPDAGPPPDGSPPSETGPPSVVPGGTTPGDARSGGLTVGVGRTTPAVTGAADSRAEGTGVTAVRTDVRLPASVVCPPPTACRYRETTISTAPTAPAPAPSHGFARSRNHQPDARRRLLTRTPTCAGARPATRSPGRARLPTDRDTKPRSPRPEATRPEGRCPTPSMTGPDPFGLYLTQWTGDFSPGPGASVKQRRPISKSTGHP